MKTRLLRTLFAAIIAISLASCSHQIKPTPRADSFSKLPPMEEKLTPLPRMERLPNFELVEGKDGKKYAALPNSTEQAQYEKLELYAKSAQEWSAVCKDSFDGSQARSKSIVGLGRATEEYTNVLAVRVDEQKLSIEEGREAFKWNTIQHYSIEVIMAIALIVLAL